MKILTVIGARPQIIKSAAISSKIKEAFSEEIEEIVIHTGQHYDSGMSDNFFTELGIPVPTYNLGVGSGNHGFQTAEMIREIEKVILKEQPDVVLIYGDTNSTLAASIAASKIHVPIAHIEAGMRSFNKSMPEELNRVLSDHSSTFLFCPTDEAVKNLRNEGFSMDVAKVGIDSPHVSNVGDIMYDNALRYGNSGEPKSLPADLDKDAFIISTIHRASNTESPEQIRNIFSAVNKISKENDLQVVLPLHPRTKGVLGKTVSIKELKNTYGQILFVEPLAYIDMLWYLNHAQLAITDSGGLQKEAAFFNTPSVVLRSETEWVELIEFGLAVLSDNDELSMRNAVETQLKSKASLPANYYGDGNASGRILNTLVGAYPTKDQ